MLIKGLEDLQDYKIDEPRAPASKVRWPPKPVFGHLGVASQSWRRPVARLITLVPELLFFVDNMAASHEPCVKVEGIAHEDGMVMKGNCIVRGQKEQEQSGRKA